MKLLSLAYHIMRLLLCSRVLRVAEALLAERPADAWARHWRPCTVLLNMLLNSAHLIPIARCDIVYYYKLCLLLCAYFPHDVFLHSLVTSPFTICSLVRASTYV